MSKDSSGGLTSRIAELTERIAQLDPQIRAWAYFDPEAALAQARALSDLPRSEPLYGVAVGVKDIFDTADMPTEYGSPIYRGHQPSADASAVKRLRRAGAVVMGKTVTTEFATWPPAKTRNPHDPNRTPGGSSSGSAAAVASGMVPLALGTQTVGSTIRPASFCGVVGFKPSRGLINLEGAYPQSRSQDTIGFFSRDVRNLLAVTSAFGLATPPADVTEPSARIAFCRTPWWDQLESDGAKAIERAAVLAANIGGDVEELDLPPEFDGILDAQMSITEYEVARSVEQDYRSHPQLIHEALRALVERGLEMTVRDYHRALNVGSACRRAMEPIWEKYDALLTPAALGQAPSDLGTTGDPTFARPWSLIGGPSISVPGMRGDDRMPIGTQLLAGPGQDTNLLGIARRFESALG